MLTSRVAALPAVLQCQPHNELAKKSKSEYCSCLDRVEAWGTKKVGEEKYV